MRLLVDIGNTRVKWALRQDGVEHAQGAWVHQGRAADPSAWAGLPLPDAVCISSVGPTAVRDALVDHCLARWRLEPRLASAVSGLAGMTNGYDHPEQLGVDRWLAALAAQRLAPGGCVLADCGTAVTVDWLDAAGCFRGGLIAPGLRAMVRALGQATTLPEPQDWDAPCAGVVVGTNTREAIRLGALHALAGMIGLLRQRTGQLPLPPVLLTGGDAGLVAGLLSGAHRHDTLVLDGLELWAAAMEHAPMQVNR